MHLFHEISVSSTIGSCIHSGGVRPPRYSVRCPCDTAQNPLCDATELVFRESLWKASSKGKAMAVLYRQGRVKLMAVTNGSVAPGSRAQGRQELLHPALLPGVTAHPAKTRARGQEQTRQFVSHPSSSPGRLVGREGGTCVLPVALQWEMPVLLAGRQHRWLQMAIP